MEEVTENDKNYFAGFFDGEGCVRVLKSYQYIQYSLKVSFTITYAPILYEMKRLFGGKVRKIDMCAANSCPSAKKASDSGCMSLDKHKQQYVLEFTGKEAWLFLKIIEPYCREKREQARIAIEFFQGKRDGRGSGLSKSQIERCEYFYNKLQELKRFDYDDKLLRPKDNQKTFNLYLEE